MITLSCNEITEEICSFTCTSETLHINVLLLLSHYNEIHDPEFVAKCKDDLLVEYDHFVKQLKSQTSEITLDNTKKSQFKAKE
ncbi:MAG: hypothetical protein ACXAB7_00545 [Candidatus Kariarchaeaceae archaeon]|jgi:hypothetical protein